MHMLPALFASSGTAAATGAAATATVSSGLSAASILQGVATVGGVLASLSAANSQADSYDGQAADTAVQSVADDTSAVQRNTAMKRELMRVMGENTVAAAAAGLDASTGIGADANTAASQKAATELAIDRSSQDAKRAMYRARASGYRQLASSARSSGMWQAFGTLAGGASDIIQRG